MLNVIEILARGDLLGCEDNVEHNNILVSMISRNNMNSWNLSMLHITKY
jgi:hypothetical protein